LKLIIVVLYVASIAYVHLRGRVRHKLGRQLSDHSTFLAPINCFLYLFSKLPSRPYLSPSDFPDLSPLQDHWEEIRQEGQNLMRAGEIKRSDQYNDVGFNSFFKSGWKRFYLKWYGDRHLAYFLNLAVTTFWRRNGHALSSTGDCLQQGRVGSIGQPAQNH
jgi:beta-hydroxylase